MGKFMIIERNKTKQENFNSQWVGRRKLTSDVRSKTTATEDKGIWNWNPIPEGRILADYIGMITNVILECSQIVPNHDKKRNSRVQDNYINVLFLLNVNSLLLFSH